MAGPVISAQKIYSGTDPFTGEKVGTGEKALGGLDFVPGGSVAKTGTKLAVFGLFKIFRRTPKSIRHAHKIAKSGGRHAGWYKNALGQTDSQIKKGIRKLQKQINEHKALIRNPQKTMKKMGKGDFKSLDPRQQKALRTKKWPGDIQRQREHQNILRGILKERKK